jgi:hypothetical protein
MVGNSKANPVHAMIWFQGQKFLSSLNKTCKVPHLSLQHKRKISTLYQTILCQQKQDSMLKRAEKRQDLGRYHGTWLAAY